MTIRTTEQTVSFNHPFKLHACEAVQPPGTYRVVVDEEEIFGLSFLAYRRTATMLHTPALSAYGNARQVYIVEAEDLEAALEADRTRSGA
jgi:hypothetical protein